MCAYVCVCVFLQWVYIFCLIMIVFGEVSVQAGGPGMCTFFEPALDCKAFFLMADAVRVNWGRCSREALSRGWRGGGWGERVEPVDAPLLSKP